LETARRCAAGTPQAADQLGMFACEFQPEVTAERQADDVRLLDFDLGFNQVHETFDGIVEGEGY
jgi:hypothetical protein